MFGLVSRMRPAAVSIASHVSEGAVRQGNKEFIQFLYVAVGSATELDTHIEISKAVGMADEAALQDIQRLLVRIS